MAISRPGGCQEVCQEVRSRLEKTGLLTIQEVKHGPLFEALDKCVIVRKDDLREVLRTSIPDPAVIEGGQFKRLLDSLK